MVDTLSNNESRETVIISCESGDCSGKMPFYNYHWSNFIQRTKVTGSAVVALALLRSEKGDADRREVVHHMRNARRYACYMQGVGGS